MGGVTGAEGPAGQDALRDTRGASRDARSAQSARGARRFGGRRRGMPLSLLIIRYFVYVLVATLIPAGLAALMFEASINSGTLLMANYGVTNLDRITQELTSAQKFDAGAIPSAYWYAHLTPTGEVLATDMDDDQLAQARAGVRDAIGAAAGEDGAADGNGGSAEDAGGEAFAANGGAADAMRGSSSAADASFSATPLDTGFGGLAVAGAYSYTGFTLDDGSWCVLAYELMPQFASRELRDALPNPQTLYMGAVVLSFVLPLVIFALRASHVITRKMRPLLEVAERVGRRDLDFEVGTSNVRQINDVLGAMDRMRVSLRDSLEAQWEAQGRRRAQVAALAHDLKTPLTVVRANAELLAESKDLAEEDRACATDVVRASCQLDDYVRQLIVASRADGAGAEEGVRGADGTRAGRPGDARGVDGVRDADDARVGEARATGDAAPEAGDLAGFVAAVVRDARSLAAARGTELRVEGADVGEGRLRPPAGGAASEDLLRRAALNLVDNAVEYGSVAGGEVRLAFGMRRARADEVLEGADAALGDRTDGDAGVGSAEAPQRGGTSDAAVPSGDAAGSRALSPELPVVDCLAITVDDDGPGFSPAALAHGTERFFRDDAARTRPAATEARAASGLHSGLGLAIASDAARAAGGSLTLENRRDGSGRVLGARATLVVPLGRATGPHGQDGP